jgi:hypothetical protein
MNVDGSRFSMATGRLWFIATWILYCSVGFWLHRWAALSRHAISPIVGFVVMPALAWLGYFISLAGSPYLRPRSLYRYIGLVFLALAYSFLHTCGW